MNILILEDDFIQQARIESVVAELIEKHQITPEMCEVFGKPEQLLQSIKGNGHIHLFFLDIEIRTEEKKGLEVARQIRDADPYAMIVFVTTHSEFMPLSFRYQISALDYIDKELAAEDFMKRIEAALLYANSKEGKSIAEDSFYFTSRFAQVQYPFNEVFYLETSPRSHKVVLYTKTDRVEFTANLADIVKQEKRLIQCHRSFVINPANVVKVDRHEKVVYFPNGKSCLVARTKLKQVVEEIERMHH